MSKQLCTFRYKKEKARIQCIHHKDEWYSVIAQRPEIVPMLEDAMNYASSTEAKNHKRRKATL